MATIRNFIIIFLLVTISSEATSQAGILSSLTEPQQKLFKLFSGGLTQIIWADLDVQQLKDVSAECKESLVTIDRRLDVGQEWPFRFIDSSSNSPSGILDGTLTSFGDFDECINIQATRNENDHIVKTDESIPFDGKYCTIEATFSPTPDDYAGNITDIMTSRIPVFGSRNFNLGLCLPSSCSDEDVSKFVIAKLTGYPLKLKSDATCDTLESMSYYKRVTNMTLGQIVALLFLLSLMGLVSVGTQAHALDLFTNWFLNVPLRDYAIIPQIVDIIVNFSVGKSIVNLVTTDKKKTKINFLEVMTVILIGGTIFIHASFSLESSLGLAVIHRLHDLKYLLSATVFQPFFSEGFFSILPFLMGYSTYAKTSRLMAKNKFNPISAIFRKYFKLVSLAAVVIALDFLWPLIAMGPLYTRVGNELLSKCSKTWWTHILMTSNSVALEEVCAPHMVYSSLFFQLFVIGLGLSWITITSPTIGYPLCFGLLAWSIRSFTNAQLPSPVMFDALDFSVEKTMSYISQVHLSVTSQMSSFVFGIMAASSLIDRKTNSLKTSDVLFAITFLGVSLWSPLIYLSQTMDIEPSKYTIFVIMTKMTSAAGCYFLSKIWSWFTEQLEKSKEVNNNETDVQLSKKSYSAIISDNRVISFPKVVIHLSFSMFLLSLFYIRLDYFVTRLLYSASPYDATKRTIYSLAYILFLSINFHLQFVAPFKAIRKTVFG